MIAFPDLLIEPAKAAGMKIPDDVDSFDSNDYPHFQVFCNIQLGQSMPYWTVHWDNAKAIAAIPEDKIRYQTVKDLVEAGVNINVEF